MDIWATQIEPICGHSIKLSSADGWSARVWIRTDGRAGQSYNAANSSSDAKTNDRLRFGRTLRVATGRNAADSAVTIW